MVMIMMGFAFRGIVSAVLVRVAWATMFLADSTLTSISWRGIVVIIMRRGLEPRWQL
jgi:hypothetical protein